MSVYMSSTANTRAKNYVTEIGLKAGGLSHGHLLWLRLFLFTPAGATHDALVVMSNAKAENDLSRCDTRLKGLIRC